VAQNIYTGPMFAKQALDNLAFIAKKRLGRDAVLEHSKFSFLLGNCEMFLVYGEILVIKGDRGDEPCLAMHGLLDQSMEIISSYTW
jgi:hypothetical protein